MISNPDKNITPVAKRNSNFVILFRKAHLSQCNIFRRKQKSRFRDNIVDAILIGGKLWTKYNQIELPYAVFTLR